MIDPNLKTCTKCGEAKLPVAFYCDRSARDGLQSYCKACKGLRSRKAVPAPPIKLADLNYVRRHGITRSDKVALCVQANWRCEKCERPLSSLRAAYVDKNRDGQIRGILCRRCKLLFMAVVDLGGVDTGMVSRYLSPVCLPIPQTDVKKTGNLR